MKKNNTPSRWQLIRLAIWIVITDPIKRKFGMFDSTGLRYSLKHLRKIKREIATYNIYAQAKYADKFTTLNATDSDFLKKSWTCLDISNPELYRNMNATGVGNLAYMALNSHGKYAQLAKQMLQKYRDYVKATGTTKVLSLNKTNR